MSDACIDAFVGGVIGGFAAVGVTNIALQALQQYQQRQVREQMQTGSVRIRGDKS